MNKPIYLDYAATTPVDPRVAKAMTECLTLDGNFANPASRSHIYGWQAESAVETARRQVADLIVADTRAIVWTSGATEANNLAIKGAASAHQNKGRHLITSQTEHKAVLDCFAELERQGFEVTYLQPTRQGVITAESLSEALRPDTALVSLMHVNNELGVVNDIAALGACAKNNGSLFHVDAAQSVGKLPIDVNAMNVDLMSMCAHKIYGPKGIGALYVRRQPPLAIDAQIHGGGHERGMRSGTLPVHQCVGMGTAFEIAAQEMKSEDQRISALTKKFLGLVLELEGVVLNGSGVKAVPNIANICFQGFESDRLMMVFRELAISSGSACTSASLEPSHVLRAIGMTDDEAHASLRFSFGRFTTEDDIDVAVQSVTEGLVKLKSL